MLLAATATLWLGSTLFLQVLGRLFQGAAAAMVWITGLALIVDTVGSSEAGHYMSYVALAMMVGTYALAVDPALPRPRPILSFL